jgi:hypothetical protein
MTLQNTRVGNIAVIGILSVFSAGVAQAQNTVPKPMGERSSVERKALEAFRGADLEGKDGPLSKAGYDLALLYYDHQRAEKEGTKLKVDIPARIEGNRVAVDAIAEDDRTSELRTRLSELGAQRLASSGRIISGLIVIPKIPEIAHLPSLQSLRLSVGDTQPDSPSTSEDTAGGSGNEDGNDTGAIGFLFFALTTLLIIEYI